MDKLAQVKIAPLVVNGQTIRFAQAEFFLNARLHSNSQEVKLPFGRTHL